MSTETVRRIVSGDVISCLGSAEIEALRNILSRVDKVVIGDFIISVSNFRSGDFWIARRDGEGMQVDKNKFEQIIADFYRENF